jgi:hypothetical protein
MQKEQHHDNEEQPPWDGPDDLARDCAYRVVVSSQRDAPARVRAQQKLRIAAPNSYFPKTTHELSPGFKALGLRGRIGCPPIKIRDGDEGPIIKGP